MKLAENSNKITKGLIYCDILPFSIKFLQGQWTLTALQSLCMYLSIWTTPDRIRKIKLKVTIHTKLDIWDRCCFNIGLESYENKRWISILTPYPLRLFKFPPTFSYLYNTFIWRLFSVIHRRSSIPSKHDTLKQCWLNVGPPSATLAQHKPNIVSMCPTVMR